MKGLQAALLDQQYVVTGGFDGKQDRNEVICGQVYCSNEVICWEVLQYEELIKWI